VRILACPVEVRSSSCSVAERARRQTRQLSSVPIGEWDVHSIRRERAQAVYRICGEARLAGADKILLAGHAPSSICGPGSQEYRVGPPRRQCLGRRPKPLGRHCVCLLPAQGKSVTVDEIRPTATCGRMAACRPNFLAGARAVRLHAPPAATGGLAGAGLTGPTVNCILPIS
jgi:hypothetical protein